MTEAKSGAARLLGCYRTGDANDPETYVAAVISVLVMYPVETIRAVTEPATGLPSKLKWLPSIAEVKEACEALQPSQAVRWALEWDESAKRQLQERKTLAIEDHRPRKTMEQHYADLAAAGLDIKPKKLNLIDARAVCGKHSISQADWDSIPNAK